MKYSISNGVRIFGVPLLNKVCLFHASNLDHNAYLRTADNYYTAYLLALMRDLHRLSKRARP